MKINSFILFVTFLAIIPLVATSNVKATDTIKLKPTENHHIVELNSNQPYVAGYHVNTPDLDTYEGFTRQLLPLAFLQEARAIFHLLVGLEGACLLKVRKARRRAGERM